MLMIVVLAIMLKFSTVKITAYCFIAVAFLSVLNFIIWYFINGNPNLSENAVIRRIMVGSMLRLLGSAIFLVITLLAVKPVDKIFVWTFFIGFCVFLMFEIWETRSKLRPNSKQQNIDKNA